MKVRITNKVHHFGLGGKKYVPGDIVEIDEAHFSPDFMEKVVEVKETGEVVVEPKVEAPKPVPAVMRRQIRKLPEEP